MLDTAATGDLTLAACSEVEVVLQKEEITVRVKSSVLSTAVSETSSHSESALCLHLSPELSPEGSHQENPPALARDNVRVNYLSLI